MKLGDLVCLILLAVIPAVWASGWEVELGPAGLNQRQLMGFLAFALMGPAGEAFRARLAGRAYPRPVPALASALLWGLHGLAASLLYWVFNGGVIMAQTAGFLPGGGFGAGPGVFRAFFGSFFFTGPLFTAILVSLILNPVLTALQRLALAWLGLWLDTGRRPGLAPASWKADWPGFIRYQLVCGPLIRLPLLTAVFMLPQNMWLPAAAWSGALVTALEGLGGGPKKKGRAEKQSA